RPHSSSRCQHRCHHLLRHTVTTLTTPRQPPTQHHHHLCRCPATFYTTVAIAANSSPLPHCHQLTPLTPTTATTTAATSAAFPAAAAADAGCGWKISHHHRGAVLRQTTIVVAVGRRYSHHSHTLWCRAVMAQPQVKPRGGQPLKTTTVVAVEPTTATTAAPWWCRACGGDSPKLLNYCYILFSVIH
nr:hypothetical protein [Tanacetum cinerariifolium]